MKKKKIVKIILALAIVSYVFGIIRNVKKLMSDENGYDEDTLGI